MVYGWREEAANSHFQQASIECIALTLILTLGCHENGQKIYIEVLLLSIAIAGRPNHLSNFYNICSTYHRSGSREAQTLLFRHSVDGDLTGYVTFSVRPEAAAAYID